MKFLRGDVAILSVSALSRIVNGTSQTLLTTIQGGSTQSTTLNLTQLLSEVTAEHKTLFESEANFAGFTDYLVNDTSTAKLLTNSEIQALLYQESQPTSLTYSQAAADVNLLFRALHSAYGAYYYFGQDAFEAAEKEVMTWLSGKQTVSTSALEKSKIYKQKCSGSSIPLHFFVRLRLWRSGNCSSGARHDSFTNFPLMCSGVSSRQTTREPACFHSCSG